MTWDAIKVICMEWLLEVAENKSWMENDDSVFEQKLGKICVYATTRVDKIPLCVDSDEFLLFNLSQPQV